MPTNKPKTIADVLIEELELILKRRDHPHRKRQVTGPPSPPDDKAIKAIADCEKARTEKIQQIQAKVNEAKALGADAQMMKARTAMLDEHVTGLSLSGGGIRAGTFAVGFLQGIANLGLLDRFDYLSTVSGGGYAGAWLTSWIKREGDVKNVERQLDFSRVRQAEAERGSFQWDVDPRPAVDEEPEPLRHLRSYSSYLFPNPGPLSFDTWTVIVIWLRNVLINLLMLFPLAMLAVLAARLGVFFFNFLNADNIASVTWGGFFAHVFLILGLAAAIMALGLNASSLREFRTENTQNQVRSEDDLECARWKACIAFWATIVAAFSLTVSSRWILWNLGEWLESRRVGDSTILNNQIRLAKDHLDLLQLTSFLFVMVIFAAFMASGAYVNGWKYGGFKKRWQFVRAAFGAGAMAGFLFVLVLGMIRSTILNNQIRLAKDHLDLLQLTSFLFVIGIFALFMAIGACVNGWNCGGIKGIKWPFVRAAACAGAMAGFLFVLVLGMIRAFARMNRPDLMATFAIPGALAVVIGSIIVEVEISGRTMTEAEREWWGRYNAKLAVASILWVTGIGATLYLPAAFLSAGAYARVAIASGWLGTTALGVLTGRFMVPKLRAKRGGQVLAKVATIAPPIFLIGLLGLVGLLASLLLNTPGLNAPHGDDLTRFGYYLEGVQGTSVWMIVLLGFGFGGIAFLGFNVVDVNLFSLNAMYANRLVRCYVGASRPMKNWKERWDASTRDMKHNAGAPSISLSLGAFNPSVRDPNPVTDFDPNDDLALSELRIGHAGTHQREYWGPHLLVNTTLNLVAGSDLAWRSRKGESFLLSSLYCGAKGVGYVKLENNKLTRANLTLGRAISISGAAVDPNMRFYRSRSLTALLALFNARLGSWMQNPRTIEDKPRTWTAKNPMFGGWLWAELFGQTDGTGEFVHLSDGGHFENMGVYELIRRRCRYIVALDAGEETDPSDSNLATLIRLCRIDFGIRIQIDTSPLRPQGPDRLTKTHATIGSIRYDDVDQGQLPGVLVYVKISITGDEPPDLQNYALNDTNFPYQPTDLRQSFDEEQFECYRCLGDHIACKVFEDAVHEANRFQFHIHSEPNRPPHVVYVPLLFSALQSRWNNAPELEDENFVESTQPWIALQRDLRNEPDLGRLSRELYPELPPSPKTASPLKDPDRAEAHAVSQMLQIMENTWLTLALRRNSDLPLNRGWVNTFRRWVNTSAFQRLWPALRPEYGSDFCRFCEEELHLRVVEPKPVQIGDPVQQAFEVKAINLLTEEYQREWAVAPETVTPAPSLDSLIENAKALAKGSASPNRPPVWLIVQEPSPPLPTQGGPQPVGNKFVTGIILAAEYANLAIDFPGLDTSKVKNWNACDLKLMSSLKEVSEIPAVGNCLVIVAVVSGVLHFRIFDGGGNRVVDKDENQLTNQSRQIADLKEQLACLWPPNVLPHSEKVRCVAAVASIVGYTQCKGIDVELVVWIRRGYRSTLLGSPRVRDVLETKLPAVLGVVAKDKLPTLWARYPKSGEDGESDHEWQVWLNFLARFDFHRCYAREPKKWTHTLLRRG